ncbi:MAG: hypothetical protein AAGN35_02685 [Bacteroidota bacterium]
MKRLQTFCVLIAAGILSLGTLQASSTIPPTEVISQNCTEPNAIEERVLRAAGCQWDMCYMTMHELFIKGEVFIGDNGDETYTVILQKAAGNPLIATIDDRI